MRHDRMLIPFCFAICAGLASIVMAAPPKSAVTAKKAVVVTPPPVRGRILKATPSGNIAFPSTWGKLRVRIQQATTSFDDFGTPFQKVLSGEAIDDTGVVRGHVSILYTYATGAVSTMNGQIVVLTATVPQQAAILNGATTDIAILNAAVVASAATLIN